MFNNFDLPFEWFVLLLRIVFIFLLYFFVFQVIRVISRELRSAAYQGKPDNEISGGLIVDDPGESELRRGDRFLLDPVTVIGRNRRATISIESSFISSEHSQISWDGKKWWITDLHSTNGTFVNAQQINVPTALKFGDHVDIGGVQFQLVP